LTFELLLVGYGNVARRFVGLLDEQADLLSRHYGFRPRIVGIATRHRCAHGPSVVSAFRRTNSPAKGGHYPPSVLPFLRDALKRSVAAARQRRLIVVETTTLDIERGEPAISHIRAALAGGAHVVTANKGPVAFAYHRIGACRGACATLVPLRGCGHGRSTDLQPGTPDAPRGPDPRLPRRREQHDELHHHRNGTRTAVRRRAVGDAGARVAEADASLDVDGWDAAAKTAALANVLLGANITPRQVDRRGIGPDTGAAAKRARAEGRRLKLVARADRKGRRVTASVGPEELSADDLLAGLEGQQNALILRTDLLEEIAIVQRSGSLTQTAYALLSDLISIAQSVRSGHATRRSPVAARRRRSL
jgi:Homoserine dehydrogenase